eukprot:TRINITY_DN24492_c0_g3_i1.p1 TRINITY_DN24492_c0_g3~~TRINITY_DN24492_c0_g3_i1.p1  ORF type:complete len:273 (+),score=32.12 TRINITY_DN24492_c0_g3_i1:56-820(+)
MGSNMEPAGCMYAAAPHDDSWEVSDVAIDRLLQEMPADARLEATVHGAAVLLSRRVGEGVLRGMPTNSSWEIFEVRAEENGATRLEIQQYIMRLLACLDGTDVNPEVVFVSAYALLSADVVPFKHSTWRTLTFTAILAVLRRLEMHPDNLASAKRDMLRQLDHFWPEALADMALDAFEEHYELMAVELLSADEMETDSEGWSDGSSESDHMLPLVASSMERGADDTELSALAEEVHEDQEALSDERRRSTKLSL